MYVFAVHVAVARGRTAAPRRPTGTGLRAAATGQPPRQKTLKSFRVLEREHDPPLLPPARRHAD